MNPINCSLSEVMENEEWKTFVTTKSAIIGQGVQTVSAMRVLFAEDSWPMKESRRKERRQRQGTM